MQREVSRPSPGNAGTETGSGARGYLFAVGVVIAVTVVSAPLAAVLDKLNVVMVYLLGVVVVATRCGRGPAVLATVGGVAVFDFVFVPPHLTLAVSDTQYVVTFAVMLVVGLVVSSLAARVREVSETALRAEFAAESEKLRSTLLSSVSHDLRTPLAAITGAASALRDEASPAPSFVHELASTVLDEAERLNRLVRNLLDMTRLESGNLAPQRDWHSLEEVVGSALARVERYAGESRFRARVDPELPLVAIDAVLVEQALVNLLENALRHGGRSGTVEVAARREGDDAVLAVCDEGPGFPPEQADRLFEKFHRAAGGPGAGLGLAIARAIVTAHGGTIRASLREPRGACFSFTLPLTEPPASPPPEEPVP